MILLYFCTYYKFKTKSKTCKNLPNVTEFQAIPHIFFRTHPRTYTSDNVFYVSQD